MADVKAYEIKKMIDEEADRFIKAMEEESKYEENVPSMQKAKFIPPRIRPARKINNSNN